jgi:hypothetical protein
MIGRRTFLQWSTAAPLLLNPTMGSGTEGAVSRNTLVVIDGIHPGTNADQLSVILIAFARKGLPVTCVIEADAGARLQPDSALCTMLRHHWQRLPGLIEIASLVSDLGTLTPYFQARATYEARSTLYDGLLGDIKTRPEVVPSRTIACDVVDMPLAPSGVRASGIRNVLMRPSVTMPVQPEAWDNGVLRMIGGQRVQLTSPPSTFSMTRQQAVERVLYLSADDFSHVSLATQGSAAAEFAANVLRQDGPNWVSPLLASDIQYRDAYSYQRHIALHFLISANANLDDHAELTDFRQGLINAGISSSFGSDTSKFHHAGYWVSVNGQQPAGLLYRPVGEFKSVTGDAVPIDLPSVGTPYGIPVNMTGRTDSGIDRDGVLRVPSFFIRDPESISNLSPANVGNADCVIVISSNILRNRPLRNTITHALQALAHDGFSAVTTLPDYVRRFVPKGPYITHFRRTQTYGHRAELDPAFKRSSERQRLIEDAKVAWSYFERWTNKRTGLCPATVNFSKGGRRLHEAVTMWDVGSQINAIIAAADLNLITPEKFQQAIRQILPNIAGRRSQDRLLPQGWIATNKFKWGNRNFDGCDAGRLLGALYNLDSHPLAAEKGASIVASWNLQEVVKNGIIHSVESSNLVSTFESHCAHYAAWAFRLWGIEARSPYEVFQGRSKSDGQMALLEVGGRIGPMGAEPLLLEALELGMSPESAYLAEVLFAAQLEEFEQSGRMICVSEGPIDSPPWFLYQGLQFDAQGKVWATDTVEGLSEHRTESFSEKTLAISSKAAYLWAAYKSHPYCDALVALVRDKAMSSNGFASSINQRTGLPYDSYTDINTNAVILQSIARILKDTSQQGGKFDD